MKSSTAGLWSLALLVASAMAGCTADPDQSADHVPHEGHDHHEEEAEAPSGATYKAGKGVLVKDEMKRLWGMETVEVTGKMLPAKVEFTMQAFRSVAGGRPSRWLAAGLVPGTRHALLQPGLEVALRSGNGTTYAGRLLRFAAAPRNAAEDVEAIVEFSGPTTNTPSLLFLEATLALPPTGSVALVVPQGALLRTAEGVFVYTVNGQAYQRTAVKTGSDADGLVEITDGLLEGDSVVSQSVESLYLVELRAVKGGGHSH